MGGKTASVRLLRYNDGIKSWEWDVVPSEHLLVIWFGDEVLCELDCSDEALEDLAVGHLVAAGRLRRGDRVDVQISRGGRKSDAEVRLLEGAGHPLGAGPGGNLRTTPEQIFSGMEEVTTFSEMFRETGGAHCSGYFEDGKPVILRDDVARHNTIDKTIGSAFLSDTDLGCGLLCTTGRVSTEIAERCIVAGVRILVSRGAPTSSAIRLAREGGLTLVGFTRGRRFNCYSHPERIEFSDEDDRPG